MKSDNVLAISEQNNSADFIRFIDFFAEMLEKYGSVVLDEIEAEHFDSNISVYTKKGTA
ncbi:MAG: hypothetical protein PUH54_01365 [Oscillospiraceae bacterium]|nr:hypothetical protein [Oscillospiraceae bacterium]